MLTLSPARIPARRKTLVRASTACLLLALAGCSKKDPAPVHPKAGLSIYSKGQLSATCGFYSGSGSNLSAAVTNTSLSADGHKLHMAWTLHPKAKSDVYRFQITVDGTLSSKEVEFSGEPIVILEQPFRVVMENVTFK